MSKLTMYRGDAAIFQIAAKDSAGNPVDISTGTLFFTAKSSSRQLDVDAIFQKTIGSGITVTDGPNGLATVTLVKSDTETIYAPALAVWDVQYVTAGGSPTTLASGTLLIKADVTRSTS